LPFRVSKVFGRSMFVRIILFSSCFVVLTLVVSGFLYAQSSTDELFLLYKTGHSALEIDQSADTGTSSDGEFIKNLGDFDTILQEAIIATSRYTVKVVPYRVGDLHRRDLSGYMVSQLSAGGRTQQVPEAATFQYSTEQTDELNSCSWLMLPMVSQWEYKVSGIEHVARISLGLYFYNAANGFKEQVRLISAEARSSVGLPESVTACIKQLGSKTTEYLRSRKDFKPRLVIRNFLKSDVLIELGKTAGVLQGDEYDVFRVTEGVRKKTGVLVVKELRDQFSVGVVLYQDVPVKTGDMVEERRQVLFELDPYMDSLFLFASLSKGNQIDYSAVAGGVKLTLNRSYYQFRPIFGLETILAGSIPVLNSPSSLNDTLPLYTYLGAEYVLPYERFRFSAAAAVGIVQSLPISAASFYDITHIRTHIKLDAGIQLFDDVLVYLEGGFLLGIPRKQSFTAYAGILAGAGVKIKL